MILRATVLAVGVVAVIAVGAACESSPYAETARESPAEGGAEAGAPETSGPIPDALAPDATQPGMDADVLATGFPDLTAVAATETVVYFVSRSEGIIHQVPLLGGTASELFKNSPLKSPSTVVATAGAVVWGDRGKRELARPSPAPGLALVATMTTAPVALAAGVVNGGPRIAVVAREASGAGTVRYYDLDLTFITATGVTFTNPYDVAVRGQRVWWTVPGDGAIFEGALDNSDSTLLVTGEPGCESIAADESGVYWTRPLDGVVRMRGSGPAAGVTTLANDKDAISIAADDSGVYWLTRDGRLRRSSRNETPLKTMAQGFDGSFADPHVHAIALTAQYIVWITNDGKVLRRAK